MKRLLTILFLLIALPCYAQDLARMSMGMVGGGVGVPAAVCPGSETLLIDKLGEDDYYDVGNVANNTYRGQGSFDPGANWTICSLSMVVRNKYTAGTGVSWVMEIYNMDGTALGALATGTCTSTPQTINSTGEFKFTGLNCSVTNGGAYGLVITREDHSYSATEYLQIFLKTGSWSGNWMGWRADKARTISEAGFDISMRVYGF